ncbi:MAG: hypothetical protein ACKO96_16990, partial [Flammeovirgaceae bacterium]
MKMDNEMVKKPKKNPPNISLNKCFVDNSVISLFVVIQNFVLKPIFHSIIQDKSIANPIIHCISLLVLLV